MQKRSVQRGRPAGATTFDAELAHAFGAAVRALRLERGIAQESLAHLAGIERSHMGKVERGEHMPTLAIIFKIASVGMCSPRSTLPMCERSTPAKCASDSCAIARSNRSARTAAPKAWASSASKVVAPAGRPRWMVRFCIDRSVKSQHN